MTQLDLVGHSTNCFVETIIVKDIIIALLEMFQLQNGALQESQPCEGGKCCFQNHPLP